MVSKLFEPFQFYCSKFPKYAVADIKVKAAEFAVSALYSSLAGVIGAQKAWFRFKIRHLREITGKCQMKIYIRGFMTFCHDKFKLGIKI